MNNKGTGWVPDFPNVKDYTLKSEQIRALTSHVQTDRLTGSIEDLTEQVSQALKLLTPQSENSENINIEASKKLGSLIEKLDKKAMGGIYFSPIKIHKVLKPVMSDPEILKVKRCLISLYPGVFKKEQIKGGGFRSEFDEYEFDPTFDELTKSLIQDFKAHMNLTKDGIVDFQTIDRLMWSSQIKKSMEGFNEDFDPILSPYRLYSSGNQDIEISTFLKQLKESQKEIRKIRDNTFEDVEKILKNAIITMKKSREKVRDCLKYVIKLPLTVEKWLNSSDEKMIDEWLASETSNDNSETSYSYSDSSSFHEMVNCINNLIEQLCEIPCFLDFTTLKRKRIENIAVEIPYQLFESVLKRIISNRELDQIVQLMEPVNPAVLSKMDLSSEKEGSWDFLSGNIVRRKLEEDCGRLIKQLAVLGIGSETDNSKIELRAKEALIKFKKLHDIKGRYHDSFHDSLDQIYNDFVCQQLISAIRQKIYQLIYPIVKAVFQIIMPLGQHGNLERAVEQGLETFNSMLGKATTQEDATKASDEEELKQLIIEAIQAGAAEKMDVLKKIETADNTAHLKRICLAAIQEVAKTLESEPDSKVHQVIRSLVDNYLLATTTEEEEEWMLDKSSVQKPLLQLLASSNSSQADLQVPISWSMHQNIIAHAYDLELRCLDSVDDLPEEGRSLVFVAKIGSDYHTRIFDGEGNPGMPRKLKPDEILVKQLEGAFSSQVIDNRTKNELLEKIKSRLNYTQDRWERTCLILPDLVDLSLWYSSIEDQGSLNSCTALAGVALTEYFAKKAFGKYTDVSPMFLYKAARNLMQRQGDTGASVRETMKAMVLFGVPPEEHWPYNEEKYDEEPNSFCYSFAQNYQALKYFRLDYAGIDLDVLLIQIKAILVAGFPCMFGFTLYTSIHDKANVEKGYIPYPSQLDKMEGGHAVVAVGYDDHRMIENADGKRSEGAILIRNSWGVEWGRGGYGWLPYDYVLAGLTADWWSLFQSEWFESGQFGAGAGHWTSNVGGWKHDTPQARP